jgi:peptidoglycan/LPS O-acetylase OafA/YrhL
VKLREKTEASAYLPALTGLRFVLALWVILHHISGRGMMLEQWTLGLPLWLQSWVRGGYLAVQSFFVLSGFVLARTYARARWNSATLKKYWMARFARIYPVYFLSLIVVSWFIVRSMMNPSRTPAVKAGLLLNYLLVLQGWTGNLGIGWNTPAWSLSCEFFFYLFFPAMLPALRSAGKRTIGLVLAAAFITPVILVHLGTPDSWKPIIHFADFTVGIAASRLFDWIGDRHARRGAWLYAPAIVAGALLIINPAFIRHFDIHGWGGDLNTGLRPLNLLAILGFGLGGGSLARVLATPVADFLGKASYSMYILHIPILWWYHTWAVKVVQMPALLAAAGYLVVVTAAASLSFLYVETPANRWLRSR